MVGTEAGFRARYRVVGAPGARSRSGIIFGAPAEEIIVVRWRAIEEKAGSLGNPPWL